MVSQAAVSASRSSPEVGGRLRIRRQSSGGAATNYLTQPGRPLTITMTTAARAGRFAGSTFRWRLPFTPVNPASGNFAGRPRAPQHGADQLDAALTAVARGDRDSFARLYDLVIPVVFGLIRRLLRDPSQSEEVTQEVMIEVWRTAPSTTQPKAARWVGS